MIGVIRLDIHRAMTVGAECKIAVKEGCKLSAKITDWIVSFRKVNGDK